MLALAARLRGGGAVAPTVFLPWGLGPRTQALARRARAPARAAAGLSVRGAAMGPHLALMAVPEHEGGSAAGPSRRPAETARSRVHEAQRANVR